MSSNLEFYISHSFKEEILVPYAAIRNNIQFFEARTGQRVITADGVRCKVVWLEVMNICECEGLIKTLYATEPWDFLCAWHKSKPDMVSLDFVNIRLKRLTAAEEEEFVESQNTNNNGVQGMAQEE